jgi:hypothetical protein
MTNRINNTPVHNNRPNILRRVFGGVFRRATPQPQTQTQRPPQITTGQEPRDVQAFIRPSVQPNIRDAASNVPTNIIADNHDRTAISTVTIDPAIRTQQPNQIPLVIPDTEFGFNQGDIQPLNNLQQDINQLIKRTIKDGLEDNLDTDKDKGQKLNYAIALYPDIARITHPEAPQINAKYATKINANDIPQKINSIINDLQNKSPQKRTTEIELLSHTTSQRVASLVLASDSFEKLNFSDKQIERLTATAFPK